MDAIDLTILTRLAVDGRASYTDLAEQIGLSAPSTADRVRRLEERGVVRGYTARLDPESLGMGLTAFIFVRLEGAADPKAFLAALAGLPEIVECHHVAGDDDYLLKVHVAGTRGLESFISEHLKSLPGIARTRSTVVLSSAIERPLTPREQ